MADYYNATRGPLAATLSDGTSVSMPPKKWIFLKPELESSASVLKLVDKGFLVKAKVARTVASEPVAPTAPVEAIEAPVEAPKPSAPDTAASTSPMKEEILKKKR